MKSKVFLDTNFLIYLIDPSNKPKQQKAREKFKACVTSMQAVISTQVLQEFYVTCIKKLSLPALESKELLRSFYHLEIVTISQSHIESAIDCTLMYKVSFWDALIIAAAESSRCKTLWSEDLNNGQTIRGISIVNPLN